MAFSFEPFLAISAGHFMAVSAGPEHESDILLHKAAKKYFDEAGIQKPPSVKAINTEYAELLAKKKAAYSEYRRIRAEMRELLTVKANVDRILGIGKDDPAEKDTPSEIRS